MALLAASPAAHAQAPHPDTLTTRAHRLPEAQVRAVRPSRFAVGATQWAVDSLALSQYRTGTVADVLQARTPAYIKNYGPGQLASISLRGTAARHTAVLWNGFNINLPTLGEADFNLLPLNGLREVVVQPGPAAALYGNGAIGGTVLLDTGPDFRPSPLRATVQGDLGAWGLRGSSATVQAAGGRVAVRTAASYRQADNNYPYLNPEVNGLVRRYAENAALLHQWSLSQDVALRLGTAGELTAGAWLTDADRQIQIAAGAANDHARERDQSRRLLLGYRRVLTSGGQWAVRTAWFDDVLNYTSDQVARSNSAVQTTQAQGEYTRPLGRHATLRLGAEAQHFAAVVDGYGGAITENRGAAFALLRFDPRPGLRLTGNLRQAALPAGLAPITPTVGAEWDIFSRQPLAPDSAAGRPSGLPTSSHLLTLKANLARTYRAPTLNERYWQPGGNPSLRPENGVGGEAGLRYQRPLGRATAFTGELTAYSQTVNEWVQWLPNDRGIYSPRNLRQVRSQGLEAVLGLRYGRGRYGLHGRASYAFTSTQKTQGAPDDPDPTGRQLAFVPLHQLALSLDQTLGPWQLGTTLGRTGLVYADNSGTSYLPAFWPLAATAGYTLRGAGPLALTVLVQGTNLLNSSYYTYSARPAPPRALLASLRVGWR